MKMLNTGNEWIIKHLQTVSVGQYMIRSYLYIFLSIAYMYCMMDIQI